MISTSKGLFFYISRSMLQVGEGRERTGSVKVILSGVSKDNLLTYTIHPCLSVPVRSRFLPGYAKIHRDTIPVTKTSNRDILVAKISNRNIPVAEISSRDILVAKIFHRDEFFVRFYRDVYPGGQISCLDVWQSY